MKLVFAVIVMLSLLSISLVVTGKRQNPTPNIAIHPTDIPKPLYKYSIESLTTTDFSCQSFETTQKPDTAGNHQAYLFQFTFHPDITGLETKKVTGEYYLPLSKDESSFPIILMLRGYVDQKSYKTGDGTRNAARFFAENGFIAIAPDFLGFGGSDKEAENIFERRFQTHVTAASLIACFDQITSWDKKNILIWGHSNGGQIALTLLEITGKPYPTTLWAPVTKPFPYSILYYTDELEDNGKMLRQELAKFESLYDVEQFSLTNFFNKITAPIQIQQGLKDEAVPFGWSDAVVDNLKATNIDVDYIKYPSADHNLVPNWAEGVEKDLAFFTYHIK